MRLLAFIGVVAMLIAAGLGWYFYSGTYNVAATEAEPKAVAWALEHVRRASVDRHATDQPSISMTDPTNVRAGAQLYARSGCVVCHGAPGVEWQKFSEGLNPYPPNLKEAAAGLSAPAVFWIVKNGIRMTGMPSFSKAGLNDQQIWQIAAFVKKLPEVSDADYQSWSAAP
jgi:mono/diheme cytochrome c family protein